MFEKIKNLINENSFKVISNSKYIDIINYTKIDKIEANNVLIYYANGLIEVIGNDMSVVKLLDMEILITGDIKKIEYR